MHKRSPVQQAITDIRAEMKELFRSHRFKQFKPPSLIGAASEGGVNVFSMPYFDKQAFLKPFPYTSFAKKSALMTADLQQGAIPAVL